MPAELMALTPDELADRFSALLRHLFGRVGAGVDISTSLLGFDPSERQFFLATGARPVRTAHRDPAGGWGGVVIHGSALVELVADARRHGIAGLPLHGLRVLPSTRSDTVLRLPAHIHELHGADLALFVERQERGIQRGLRYLVERNVPGLDAGLATYQTLPWAVRLMIDDQSTAHEIRVSVFRQEEWNAPETAVSVGVGVPENHRDWGWSELRFGYERVGLTAYRELEKDIRELLTGSRTLGTNDV
jgi:hypothetical protein